MTGGKRLIGRDGEEERGRERETERKRGVRNLMYAYQELFS